MRACLVLLCCYFFAELGCNVSAAAAIVVSMIVEFTVSVSLLSTKFFKIMIVTNMMLNAIQALIIPAICRFQNSFSIQQFLKKNCLKVLCFQIFELLFRLSLSLVKVVQLIPVVLIRSLPYTY